MRNLYRFFLFSLSYVLCIWLSLSDAQYSSQPRYSLDPFLGTYDMIWAQQVNTINITSGVFGVPLAVVQGGERVTFNKTSDGKYQQTVGRIDPRFNSIFVFELDKPGRVQIAGTNPPQTMTSTFTMQNSTTLHGSYLQESVDRQIEFTVRFAFYPDASGYSDTTTLIKPESSAMVSTAPFYRLKNGDTGPITLGPPAA